MTEKCRAEFIFLSSIFLSYDFFVTLLLYNFCSAKAEQFKTLSKIGGKAFPPKCAEVIECRRKKIGRMICRQNHFKSFCHKIIPPQNLQRLIE